MRTGHGREDDERQIELAVVSNSMPHERMSSSFHAECGQRASNNAARRICEHCSSFTPMRGRGLKLNRMQMLRLGRQQPRLDKSIGPRRKGTQWSFSYVLTMLPRTGATVSTPNLHVFSDSGPFCRRQALWSYAPVGNTVGSKPSPILPACQNGGCLAT